MVMDDAQAARLAILTARMRYAPHLLLGTSWTILSIALVLWPSLSPAQADEGALTFDRTLQDWGPVAQHDELEATFQMRNGGKSTVTDIVAKADCGCYALVLSDTQLAPGESGTLKVRFRTLSFSGPVSKRIRVSYLDDARRRAALDLKMKVVAGVVLDPGRMHFGEVLVGTKPEGSITAKWYDGVGKPFDVTAVELPDGMFAASRPAPYQDPDDRRWKGWRIPFAFVQAPPKGVYQAEAVIVTNHPEAKRLPVSLTAFVTGKVWVQQSRIYIGMVPRGRLRSASMVFRPFDETIRLGKVSAKSRKGMLQVRTRREDLFGNKVWRLTVIVPRTAPTGKIDDVVEIHTEVEGEEVTEIEVRGRVFEKRAPK